MSNKSFQVKTNYEDKLRQLEERIIHIEEELNEIKKVSMTTNNTIQLKFEDVFKQMSVQWETVLNAISMIQRKLIDFENYNYNPYLNDDICPRSFK